MTPNSTRISRSSSYTTTPDVKALIGRLNDGLNRILLGKDEQVKLALACLFRSWPSADRRPPGMGKTLLSHALAKVLGLSYNRIQFTSDVLPSDVIGTSVFDRESGDFRFVEGPLFAQVVLADEINRATPKSRARCSKRWKNARSPRDGVTRALPKPFFVIATQNPATQTGTFPLPESQLDRFLMRIELGYPEPDAERELLKTGDRRKSLEHDGDDREPASAGGNSACGRRRQGLRSADRICAAPCRHTRRAGSLLLACRRGARWRCCRAREPGR